MASQAGDSASEPWSDDKKKKFNSKSKSEYFDPCHEVAQRSLQCLRRNNGDREMCGDYFKAYRDCKQTWTSKRKNE